MHFPEKFYRIPLHFDHERLYTEINAVDESHWSPHPQAFKGNDALVLISSGGTINDLNYGPMQFTPCMGQLPYLKQVLESFNTVIGRTRLMRLAPGEKVGRHSDISLYWWHRFRIHVPIVTHPEVKFYCEDTHVHMQAGEAWTFDNWRYHEVHNDSDITRVHLVIDTVGSPQLWNMLEQQSWHPQPGETLTPESFKSRFIPFEENREADFETENYNIVGVLSPAELDAIVDFLWQDLDRHSVSEQSLITIQTCLLYLKRAWRAFHAAHGNEHNAYKNYLQLLTEVVNRIKQIEPAPLLKSNGFIMAEVLNTQVLLTMSDIIRQEPHKAPKIAEPMFSRVLQDTLSFQQSQRHPASAKAQQIASKAPIFIMAAAQSGGRLLESLLDSNTLTNMLPPETKQTLLAKLANKEQEDLLKLRKELLGKNSRILCFDPELAQHLPALLFTFPNCRIIYLYRDPFEVLGAFEKQGATRKEILSLASRYPSTNERILKTLDTLPPEQWLALDLGELAQGGKQIIETICDFCNLAYGPRMQQIDPANLNIDRYRLENLADDLKSALESCYRHIRHWQESRKRAAQV